MRTNHKHLKDHPNLFWLPTACDVLEDNNSIAFIDENNKLLGYRALGTVINDLISDLYSFGIDANTRVATVAGNGTSNSILMLAIMQIAICCPISPNLTEYELSDQLSALEADFAICEDCYSDQVEMICDKLRLPLLHFEKDKESWGFAFSCSQNFEEITSNAKLISRTTNKDIPYSLILLTSGSTGRPKRVGLSIDNLMHSAKEIATSLQLDQSDVCLSMWEQYHIGGVVDLLLAPLVAGSTILMTSGFSSNNFRNAIRYGQFTWLQCVPTTLREMLYLMKTENIAVPSSLRLIRSVASNLHVELQKEAEESFGVPVLQTYGMTEASPLITSNLLSKELRKIGTVGKPLSTEIQIISNGSPVTSPGQVGEILIRGKNVIQSYDDPTGETIPCFKNGWFRTGDLGFFDTDGFLILSGREKQQINRGGEKISPKEIETCCISYDPVLDAVAVGITHPTLGFVPAVIVSHSPDFASSDVIEGLRLYLKSRLTSFKQPVYIWSVDKLPKTVTGKILHDDLDQLVSAKISLSNDISRRFADKALQAPFLAKVQNDLKEIWLNELEVDDCGFLDDFVALGGDSLSSLRVILAAENLFKVKYPDHKLPEMTNISSMAVVTKDLILSRGNSVEDSTQFVEVGAASVEHNSKRINSFSDSFDATVDSLNNRQFFDFFMELESTSQIETAIERKMNIWTPKELFGFAKMWRNKLSRNGDTSFNAKYEIHRKSFRKLSALLQKLDLPYVDWNRVKIEANAFFYSSSRLNIDSPPFRRSSSQKTLVIGFAGRMNRMLLPTYLWLGKLDHSKYDFLFVWDGLSNYYKSGVGGFASTPSLLVTRINGLIEDFGYSKEKVVGVGASMGAYPCAAIVRQLGCKSALLLSPGCLSDYPEYVDLLKNAKSECMLYLCCGKDNPSDVIRMRKFSANFSPTHSRFVKGCSGHNVLWYLSKKGAFADFISSTLEMMQAT